MITQSASPATTDGEVRTQRARVYRLFATLFARELTLPDIAVLRRLAEQTREAAEADELAARLVELVGTLPAEVDADGLLTLREEFAYLFLGAGGPPVAPPYESTYRGERHLFGSAAAEVQELLAARRLAAPPTLGPPDHLSVELSLMARLIDDGAPHAAQHLLSERLLSWTPALTTRLEEVGRLGFYPALARALLAFVPGDAAYLEENGHVAGAR